MTIEIVDLPIKTSDFPLLFVCLPEGNTTGPYWTHGAPDLHPRFGGRFVICQGRLEGFWLRLGNVPHHAPITK